MNKQELIEQIKCLKNIFGNKTKYVEKDTVIKLISELDEPEKILVSEEEAKFLKTFNFRRESDVTKALYYVSRTGFCYYLTDGFDTELKGLSEGFRDLENRKRLIRAILFGYEVEKEKRYTVTVKGDIKEKLLGYGKTVKRYFFTKDYDLYNVIYSHTRKQLEEAGFGWVFSCEGIEIEEVEE